MISREILSPITLSARAWQDGRARFLNRSPSCLARLFEIEMHDSLCHHDARSFLVVPGLNRNGGGLRRSSMSAWFAPSTASTRRSEHFVTIIRPCTAATIVLWLWCLCWVHYDSPKKICQSVKVGYLKHLLQLHGCVLFCFLKSFSTEKAIFFSFCFQ